LNWRQIGACAIVCILSLIIIVLVGI